MQNLTDGERHRVAIPGSDRPGSLQKGPRYFIDSDAVVWRYMESLYERRHGTRWKKLKSAEGSSNGYLNVTVRMNGKIQLCAIHFLVLTVFKGQPRPDGMVCRHLDGNKRNNHPDNLCWGTYSENSADTIKHGYRVSDAVKKKMSERCHCRVLGIEDVRRIRERFKSHTGTQYGFCKLVSEEYGLTRNAIGNLLDGKTWKASCP